MPVLLMVGSFVSFIHLLPLQAKLLQTISGEAASSKRLYTTLKLPAPHRATSSTMESMEYSTPQSKLQPRFSKSGMALIESESESDSTMFDPRLVSKFNQTT